jgi:hypothetical protein
MQSGGLPEWTMGRWRGQTRSKAGLLIDVCVRAKWGLYGVSALGAVAALVSWRAHVLQPRRGGQRAVVAWLGRGAELLVLVWVSRRDAA